MEIYAYFIFEVSNPAVDFWTLLCTEEGVVTSSSCPILLQAPTLLFLWVQSPPPRNKINVGGSRLSRKQESPTLDIIQNLQDTLCTLVRVPYGLRSCCQDGSTNGGSIHLCSLGGTHWHERSLDSDPVTESVFTSVRATMSFCTICFLSKRNWSPKYFI